MIDASGRDIRLEVDGGLGPDNIADVAAASANAFVAGSAIFKAVDYKSVVDQMRANLATVAAVATTVTQSEFLAKQAQASITFLARTVLADAETQCTYAQMAQARAPSCLNRRGALGPLPHYWLTGKT